MKRSSVLSRTFFRRPAVRELVPDLKLVLIVLTVSCESNTGIYRPAGLAEDAGLDAVTLAGALVDLERRGHILVDHATGEIFIIAFYRDNTFKGKPRFGQWVADWALAESEKLRAAAVKAIAVSAECGLVVTENGTIKLNQSLTVQDKDKDKDKEEEKQEAALPSVAAVSKQAKTQSTFRPGRPASCASGVLAVREGMRLTDALDLLRQNGEIAGGDLERDRRTIAGIRDIAAWVGDEEVVAAMVGERYPSDAQKACDTAGLQARANGEKQRRRVAEGDAKAAERRALQDEAAAKKMTTGNKSVADIGGALGRVIGKIPALTQAGAAR